LLAGTTAVSIVGQAGFQLEYLTSGTQTPLLSNWLVQ